MDAVAGRKKKISQHFQNLCLPSTVILYRISPRRTKMFDTHDLSLDMSGFFHVI